MDSSLISLVSRPPSETSGARTSSRYDYQKNWTICKLAELHLKGSDYLIVCDYHDDVIVIDDLETLPIVTFVQVKSTKAATFILSKILNSKDGGSILSKLLSNLDLCGENLKGFVLVSNAPFQFKKKLVASPEKVKLSDLNPEDIQQVTDKIKAELDLDLTEELRECIYFHCASLSLADQEAHTKGVLTEFLEKTIPGKSFSSGPIYRTLFGEISRRSGNEEVYSDFALLTEGKGLDKSLLESIVADLGRRSDPDKNWEVIGATLLKEGVSPIKIRNLFGAWSEYEISRMDETNEGVRLLRSWAFEVVKVEIARDSDTSLGSLMESCVSRLSAEILRHNFDSTLIKAAILFEAYES